MRGGKQAGWLVVPTTRPVGHADVSVTSSCMSMTLMTQPKTARLAPQGGATQEASLPSGRTTQPDTTTTTTTTTKGRAGHGVRKFSCRAALLGDSWPDI